MSRVHLYLVMLVVAALVSVSTSSNEVLYEKDEDGRICVDNGSCMQCSDADLKEEDACKETGLKMPVLCDKKVHEFRSCDATPEDERVQVIWFQLTVAAIGSLAFWAVRRLKDNSLSLFDARKKAAKSYLPV